MLTRHLLFVQPLPLHPTLEDTLSAKPVKQVKIADQVVVGLQDWFRSGELTPGMRLPPERALAARFGVSRTSLRDALRRLELLGHLDARQGDGTYVRVPDGEALSEPFRSLVNTWPRNAADLLEFRTLLEPDVAALAAERLTPAGEQALLGSIGRQRALAQQGSGPQGSGPQGSGQQGSGLTHEDALFHGTLAQVAGNTVVLRVLETLRDLLQGVRATSLPAAGMEKTVSDHERIVQAVLAQDRDGARQAMRLHLQDVADTYRRAVRGMQTVEDRPEAASTKIKRKESPS